VLVVNVRHITVTLGGVVLSASLVACGGGSSGGSTQAGSATTPASHHHHHHHSSTPTPTPPATPTASVTAPPPPVAPCVTAQLSIELGQASGAAGTSYQPIVFVNNGTVRCWMYGYPGVSFITSSGKLIGKPASEDPGKGVAIGIPAGGEAHAVLRLPNPGNFSPSACAVTTADRLRVYPPNQKTPLYVNDAAQVCSTSAGRTGVSPVKAGNGA